LISSFKTNDDIDTNRINSIVKEVIDSYIRQNKTNNSTVRDTIKTTNPGNYDRNLAKLIEHSMIRPDATPAMVEQFCAEAVKYGFVNVSVPTCFVKMASDLLKGTGVKTSSAVSFPFGNTTTRMKVEETLEIINCGGVEIDLPINIGMFKSGDVQFTSREIKSVVEAAGSRALIKVVVDLGQLTQEEQIKVALIAKMSGASFLKVAAGSKPGGMTLDDIRMIRSAVGTGIGIKADGGIRNHQTAVKIIEAGATRIGASGSVKIVTYG
jgi:deoxyribose-phosphate aldolase